MECQCVARKGDTMMLASLDNFKVECLPFISVPFPEQSTTKTLIHKVVIIESSEVRSFDGITPLFSRLNLIMESHRRPGVSPAAPPTCAFL